MPDLQPNPDLQKRPSKLRRLMRWMVFLTVVTIVVLFWWKYYFVLGEGVKSGQLNFMVRKGYIFKTYEGKLIQSGLRSKTQGVIQNYEFDFSVENDSIAKMLMLNSGKYFDLHYREYNSTVPWRGYSKYVVDAIVSMETLEK